TKSKDRIPLVAWDRFTLLNKVRGLGLKDLKRMNLALMAKFGWKIKRDDGLWANILKEKYMYDEKIYFISNEINPKGSCFWNGQ
ncbi:hypothetical protein KI387_029974, partial [Taxus chinensis]